MEKNKFQIFRKFRTFSELFDPKTGFFHPKTGNYFQTYFLTIFSKFLRVRKDQIFPKNSELRKLNYSETRENKKFGKLCLTQGLNIFLHNTEDKNSLRILRQHLSLSNSAT